MKYSTEHNWYAVRTRSKAEQLVFNALRAKLFEVLMPTYQAISQRKDRRIMLTKPIFRGYLFVRLQLDAEKHLEILKTLGVIQILKNSQGPLLIPGEQIPIIDHRGVRTKASGSSFAVPRVVAMAVRYLSNNPNASVGDIKCILI